MVAGSNPTFCFCVRCVVLVHFVSNSSCIRRAPEWTQLTFGLHSTYIRLTYEEAEFTAVCPMWVKYKSRIYVRWVMHIQRALGPVCRVRHPTTVRWHHRQMHAATTQRGRTHTAVVCSVSKSECRIRRVMGPLSSPVECNIRVRHLAAVFA